MWLSTGGVVDVWSAYFGRGQGIYYCIVEQYLPNLTNLTRFQEVLEKEGDSDVLEKIKLQINAYNVSFIIYSQIP